MKKVIAFVLFLAISIGISSCGDENKSVSTNNSYENYSLNLEVKTMRSSYIDFSDITRIILDVNSSTLNYVVEQEFIDEGAGNWTIDLIQLPMGKDLTFKARAFIGATHSYTSNKILQLVTGDNNITMDLQEESIFSENTVQVQSMDTTITTIDDVNYTTVTFTIYNVNEDALDYIITDDDANGTLFDPSSGTITVYSSRRATLDINYTRPEVAGTYRNRIKITSLNGDIFIYAFDLTVNDNDEVFVLINQPAEIEGFIVTQEDQNLNVEVNATDPDGDNSTLTYQWVISDNDGGTALDATSSTTSTAIITGFDDGDLAKLTVEVTDTNGSVSTGVYKVNIN